MRVHFIGHASLLIEADGVTILMDPVFSDPNYEGTNTMCPQREVRPEQLPQYDVIAVSHRHLDHFDIRTLASLDRSCTVVIPDRDPLLESAIKRLGFDRIQFLRDKQSLFFGKTTITATPSKANVREVGFILRDSTATIWNQVDTIIDSTIACNITDQFGPFDLLLSPWQPLLEAEILTNGITSFPYSTYFSMLSNVQVIHPRAVIPSACGFKYFGQGEWLNKFVFPATREMFLRDVSAFGIGIHAMAANPGDVAEVQHGEAVLRKAASSFVQTIQDDVSDVVFDPTGFVPELTDSNPGNYNCTEMLSTIETFITSTLMPILRDSAEQQRIAYEYQQINLVYRLDVVFPQYERSWSIEFGNGLSLTNEPSPVAHIRSRIVASVLTDLIAGQCSLNYVYGAGLFRSLQRIYASGPHGMYRWTPTSESSIVDPLWIALDPEALFEKYVERELASSLDCLRENRSVG